MATATVGMPKVGVRSDAPWTVGDTARKRVTVTDKQPSLTIYEDCLRDVKRNNPSLTEEEAMEAAEYMRDLRLLREKTTRNFLTMGITTEEEVMEFVNEEIRAYQKEKAELEVLGKK